LGKILFGDNPFGDIRIYGTLYLIVTRSVR
jgi:hypothetical protein